MIMPKSRLSMALLLGALVAAFVTPATAGAAGGGDSASGHGSQFGMTFDFSGRSSNVNTDARGRIRVTMTNQDPNDVYTAEVTCMRVVGATATTPASAVLIGRIVDQPPGQGVVSLVIHAADSGKVSNVPDSAIVGFSGAPAPPDGACPPPVQFISPLAEGEVTINNTLP